MKRVYALWALCSGQRASKRTEISRTIHRTGANQAKPLAYHRDRARRTLSSCTTRMGPAGEAGGSASRARRAHTKVRKKEQNTNLPVASQFQPVREGRERARLNQLPGPTRRAGHSPLGHTSGTPRKTQAPCRACVAACRCRCPRSRCCCCRPGAPSGLSSSRVPCCCVRSED